MNEQNSPKIDKTASDAIKRVETQMVLDGKLNKAIAVEGAGVLFMLPALAVLGGLSVMLGFLGFSDAGRVVIGAALITVGIAWASFQMAKRSSR